MPEYYRLNLLRKTQEGSSREHIEHIYLEIDGKKSKIMGFFPNSARIRPLSSNLEKISEKEAMEFLNSIDFSY